MRQNLARATAVVVVAWVECTITSSIALRAGGRLAKRLITYVRAEGDITVLPVGVQATIVKVVLYFAIVELVG